MADTKRTTESKRTKRPRNSRQTNDFIKDWERLERSGKHDMNRLKEAMMLLVANDAPLPPEWNDHELKGGWQFHRECHVKGDLLLVYQVEALSKTEVVVFIGAGTHSELFSR